jgi:hypothetical protein
VGREQVLLGRQDRRRVVQAERGWVREVAERKAIVFFHRAHNSIVWQETADKVGQVLLVKDM